MINKYFVVYYKFWIDCRSIIIKIIWSDFWVFPLQHPQISSDFDSFSNFLEKLETFFGRYLLVHKIIFWRSIRSPEWHLKIAKKHPKDHFPSIFIAYRSLSAYFSLLIEKNFDSFDPLSQKKFDFISSKISIWVLQRTVLMSSRRFLILKIHWRSIVK